MESQMGARERLKGDSFISLHLSAVFEFYTTSMIIIQQVNFIFIICTIASRKENLMRILLKGRKLEVQHSILLKNEKREDSETSQDK